MRRFHLFEFTDLSFWPRFLRGLLTDYLAYVTRLVRPFVPYRQLIAQAMDASGTDRAIDLCSGSGGPWADLLEPLEQERGKSVFVTLTDKYPAVGVAPGGAAGSERIAYRGEPVDALALPPGEEGIRTIFDSFHHFAPDQARQLLRSAVSGGHAIAVFEMMRRTPLELLAALRIPLLVLLLMPRVPGRKLWRLVFTYLIPIAPLVIAWDGLVSILRCYTPGELLAMAHETGARDYVWRAATERRGFVSVTYLVGYPSPAPGLAASTPAPAPTSP